MDPDKSIDKLCLRTAGHFILFPLSFPTFSSPTPPWYFPFPPLFSSPNHPIVSPVQWVPGWWPLSVPRVLQRAPWWSDALLEQPWRGPQQGHISSLRLFGSSHSCCYALCFSVCVKMGLLSHSLANTCFPWDSFVAWVDPSLSLTCISSVILITWRALGWVIPFSSFSWRMSGSDLSSKCQ